MLTDNIPLISVLEENILLLIINKLQLNSLQTETFMVKYKRNIRTHTVFAFCGLCSSGCLCLFISY